jgi:hypothetical protein
MPNEIREAIGEGPAAKMTEMLNQNWKIHTVRKMDLILRPIERRPQMQFSIACRLKLQLLRRYSAKFSNCVILC